VVPIELAIWESVGECECICFVWFVW
jgi:hypothetical protein